MRNPFLAGLLLLLTSFVAGCGLGDPSCADCGPCGIAGPVDSPGKEILVLRNGVTEAGVAAIDLGLEEGTCVAEDRRAFRATYEAGMVKVIAASGAAKLITTATGVDGDKLTWTDRNLTMTQALSGQTLMLTFVDAGKITKVACNGANHAITCAPA
ncbi:MAG: hypothetical protein ABJE95_07285 [Byssovorax sp.]